MIRGSGLQIISSLDLILVLTHECGMVYLPGNVRQLMPEAGCNCLLVHDILEGHFYYTKYYRA